jgi:hypothetical protein
MNTIDDLLRSLQNPNKPTGPTLENNTDTWNRIGRRDKFEELGLETSELESFLKEWIESNPYNNI